MIRKTMLLLALLALTTGAATPRPAAAQTASVNVAEAPALDPDVRRTTVDSVAALVARHYVVADTGRMIARHLREQARSGAYADASTLAELARAVTADLQSVNQDLHLGVRLDSTFAATLEAGGRSAEEQAEAERQMAERARRGNQGFQRVEVLDGNVGYLKLGDAIFGSPEAFERAEQALRFLGSTDAMILDLRGVPGGSGRMANFLISHFTGPNVPSLRVYWKPDDETALRRTLEDVPGPRRTDVPLYVLVDEGSASAAEDIPFVLQNLGRATIVGETTMGAGRNNQHYAVGHGLVLSVSISRVMDPETGREWEGVGVRPDVRTPSDRALEVAHAAARAAVAGGESDDSPAEVLGQPVADPADVASPEAVLRATYEVLERRPGEPFDWARFRTLYLPTATLVPNTEQTGGEFRVLSVEDFIAWVDEHTVVGGPDDRGFQEEEISIRVERYGDIAQVFSTYQKRFWGEDEVLGRGINAVQLVRKDGRWWIAGTVWDEESGAGPLPEQYLPR